MQETGKSWYSEPLGSPRGEDMPLPVRSMGAPKLEQNPTYTKNLVLKICEKERHRESPQKAGNSIFSAKVSEPSFQIIWPCNIVLSDI